MTSLPRRVLVGKIHGAFGLRGEVKVESFTDPDSALLRYQPWLMRDVRGNERTLAGVRGRQGNKGLVASFPGVETREAAENLRGAELFVPRSVLPPPKPGEFYWVDLEGLRVATVEGVDLGTVSHIFPTGANDVLVVVAERTRMIPFVRPDVIVLINLNEGRIVVDWDPDF